MYSHIEEDGGIFIVKDGQKIATPMGRPLTLKDEAVAQEVADDLNKYGTDPTEAISMYSSVCSYLDFLDGRDKTPLIETALIAVLKDAIYDISADPEFMRLQYAGYSHPIFEENGVRCGLHQAKNVRETIEWLQGVLGNGSSHLLMCVIMAGANFESPLLGLATTDKRSDLTTIARALCGHLREHIVDAAGGIAIGGVGGYWSNHVDEDYCSCECQGLSNVTLDCSCSVYRSLDVLQRFSALPD
jgi:hypothetical protein